MDGDALEATLRVLGEDERLARFVRESNAIENIVRDPTPDELAAHSLFLGLDVVRIADVSGFVAVVAEGAHLRDQPGMDVSIVDRSRGELLHRPPRGGPAVAIDLRHLLEHANAGRWSPYAVHVAYETLHPFEDGNGRSGRVLWAWMWRRIGRDPFGLPFLRQWYYDSLQERR